MPGEHTACAVVRHQLPAATFASLAAGSGSPEITNYLWSTERSRRVIVLSALLAEAERHSDTLLENLPPADGVWEVLATAQAIAPQAFDTVVLHPQVGSWAAYALRLHRGGASSSLPLWVEFGGIHGLGLAVAARSGLKWSTRIPARAGCVMLPTLGMARFPTQHAVSVVEAATENGVVHLRAGNHEVVITASSPTGTAHWWNLRRVTVGDDLTLSVWLDDIDPFRDLADPVPPMRLDQASFDKWTTLLADAWAILCRDHRAEAESMVGGVVSLVPLIPDPDWEARSASNGEAFGSVMVSEPPDAVTMAVTLIHEYQHIKLGALMHLLPLTGAEDRAVYYAPWRDDPRPIAGLIQGIYAFYGIAGFWRRHRATVDGSARALADLEYAYARAQTAEAAAIASLAPTLTGQGRQLVSELAAQLATWSTDEVSVEMARLAELIADGHRSAWRLRHLRPDSDHVGRTAEAWLAGDPAEAAPQPVINPDPVVTWPQRIPTLARRRSCLGNPPPAHDASAATNLLAFADEALVGGDLDAAAIAYRKFLSSDPSSSDDLVRAWVGIAITSSGSLCPDDARAMRERPDLVRAVHDELRARGEAVEPSEIASWLAPAVAIRAA